MQKKGFTIVEVSLVLAIAGLIFLMMFIALPALQRSQRDTKRRESMADLISNIKKYQTNNRGALPGGNGADDGTPVTWSDAQSASGTSWAGFYHDYLGENFVDPSGEHYSLLATKCEASKMNNPCTNEDTKLDGEFGDFKIVIAKQATCSGETAIASSNPRKVAVLYKLEGGGIYCGNT